LFKRARGFTRRSEKIGFHEGGVVRAETLTYYPPEPRSIEFWLKNRRPKDWREKVDHNISADESLETILQAIANKKKGDADT
jgi:hypothetical protein